MKQEILDKLEYFKDSNFNFEPVEHKYTYEGEQFISVTTFIQQFHTAFDKDYWSNKKAIERGVTQEEILNEWQQSNDRANDIGTDTHEWIEDYFNQKYRPLPVDEEKINRINKFNKIFSTQLYKLEPVAFEVMVFSKKWKIAGMIDSLFIYKNKLYIVDWKTNKFFSTDENLKYQEKLLSPFGDFNKTHLNEYSIQLSLYALILEDCGIDIKSGYLVHIGPGDTDPSIHKIVDMRDILREYLK